MIASTQEVLIDNADVRVTRVSIPPGTTHAPEARGKRLVIAMTAHQTERQETVPVPTSEWLTRDVGDVMFRQASSHTIVNRGSETQVSIIVELKQP